MSLTPSAQFSLTIRLEIAQRPGMLGQVATAIGRAGGTIGAIDLVEVSEDRLLRDITVDAAEQANLQGMAQATGDTIGFAAIDAERMRAG
jgi:malate dehydrogenase (oxaloacetate-decarboxylating)